MPRVFSNSGTGSVSSAEIADASVTAADLAISVPQFISLASDATAVTTTAFADGATGLNIAVTNAVPVRFQYFINWTSAAGTTGARFSLNGPAITRLAYSVRWNTTATVVTQSPLGTSYDQNFTVGTDANTTQNLAIIEGVLISSASGTLALRSATEVGTSAVTVKSGSSVLYW